MPIAVCRRKVKSTCERVLSFSFLKFSPTNRPKSLQLTPESAARNKATWVYSTLTSVAHCLIQVNDVAAAQQMLYLFDITGVVHFGIAGNANNSMSIGDVIIPEKSRPHGHLELAGTNLVHVLSSQNFCEQWFSKWGVCSYSSQCLETVGDTIPLSNQNQRYQLVQLEFQLTFYISSCSGQKQNGSLGANDVAYLDLGSYNVHKNQGINLLGRIVYGSEEFFSESGMPNTAQHLLWAQISQNWLQLATGLEARLPSNSSIFISLWIYCLFLKFLRISYVKLSVFIYLFI